MSASRRDYVAMSTAIRAEVDMLRKAQGQTITLDRRNADHIAGGLAALHRAALSIGAHFYDCNPRGFDLAKFMSNSGFSQ